MVVTFNNGAHVPGLGLNLCFLHAVGKQQAVVIDPVGVHMTLVASCLPRVRGTRISTRPRLTVATTAHAKVPVHITSMDIDDMQVSCAHAHPGRLRKAARQLRFRLTGYFRAWGGCLMPRTKRQPLRKTTLSHSKCPLQRVFVNLSGPKPTQPVGGALCTMPIKDDFSHFGRTYFTKQKSLFQRVITDIRESTKTSVARCGGLPWWSIQGVARKSRHPARSHYS